MARVISEIKANTDQGACFCAVVLTAPPIDAKLWLCKEYCGGILAEVDRFLASPASTIPITSVKCPNTLQMESISRHNLTNVKPNKSLLTACNVRTQPGLSVKSHQLGGPN